MTTTQSTSKSLRRFAPILIALSMFGAACGSTADDVATSELPTLEESHDSVSGDPDGTSDNGDDQATSDEQSDDKTEEESAPIDPDEAMAKFEACMAENGIDISAEGGGNVQTIELDDDEAGSQEDAIEAMEEATKECDKILDDAFGEFEMSPEQEAEMADQNLELERCLADNGIDIDISGGAFELPADLSVDQFDELMSECAPDTQLFESGE